MKKELRVAILGATGAVGQEFLLILEQRNFPIADTEGRPGGSPLLLASKKSAGKTAKFRGREIKIEEARPESFKEIDLVLASAGAAVSRELVPHAVKLGAVVVDNTSACRMDPQVPLVIPEINPQDIE